MSTQPDVNDGAAIDSLRHRLHDVASELVPMATRDELKQRIRRIASELRSISHDLALLAHVEGIENGGLEDELQAIDDQLAAGWVPEARPVQDVLADLEREFA